MTRNGVDFKYYHFFSGKYQNIISVGNYKLSIIYILGFWSVFVFFLILINFSIILLNVSIKKNVVIYVLCLCICNEKLIKKSRSGFNNINNE